MAESRHALLISSSAYSDEALRQLGAPGQDAALLGRILKTPAVGGFEVIRLTNPTASQAARKVEAFFTDRQFDDTLLLYFSGHGLKNDRGELFFAMRDTRRNTLRSTSLPASLVQDVMGSSNSQRQMLVLDCCYGGAFSRGLTKGDDDVDVQGLLQGYGTAVLTASTALEFAWQEGQTDGDPQQSVFTRIVAEGLRTGAADLDGDGVITMTELHRYASKHIRALGTQQTPTLSALGQEGELTVGYAKPRPRPVQTQPGAPQALDLSAFTTIHDSGAEGSVVGHAIAAAMEISLAVAGRSERLSARYAYEKARVVSGMKPFDGDGATIPSGLQTARKFGIPLDDAWPYRATERELPVDQTWEDLDKVRPRFKAAVHQIRRYEEVPYHLALRRPIVTGFTVYGDSWYGERATESGWIELAEEQNVVGGHAVVIVGFDGQRNALKFANSWGSGWGDSGFGYISRDAVEQALGQRGQGTNYWAIEVPPDAKHCLV